MQKGKVSTWIASITRNRAIDMIRRYKIRPESQSVNWETAPLPEPRAANNLERKVEISAHQDQVITAVDSLPKEQKEALALAFFWGYTHQEIADYLDLPLGTVKTRIRLAMQKLRRLLEGMERP